MIRHITIHMIQDETSGLWYHNLRAWGDWKEATMFLSRKELLPAIRTINSYNNWSNEIKRTPKVRSFEVAIEIEEIS